MNILPSLTNFIINYESQIAFTDTFKILIYLK